MRLFLFILGFAIFTNNIFGQLKADFSADITNACSPLIAKFTDASTGNPTAWDWDLGNGIISHIQNPTIIYFNPGSYTITLMVTNASGTNTIVKTNYITVYNNPVVDFTANPSAGCPPLAVQFTDASSAGSGTLVSWSWDFGDGLTDTVQNPIHTYKNGSNFGISLMVKNNFGCMKTIEKPGFVNVLPLVKANFSFTYSNACQSPVSVSFSNSSSPAGLSYQWSFGDGQTSTQASPVYSYTTPGDYSVQLVATNEKGCSDTSIQKISIGTVKPDFTFSNSCINQTINFINTSSPPPLSVRWNFGDNTTDSTISTSHKYSTSGSYQVTMTADFGSCKASKTVTLIIAAKPTIAFTATGAVSQCTVPATVQFNNTTIGGTSYQWLFGDSFTDSTINPSHTYNKTGNFDVTLIATGIGGCTDTLTRKKLINLTPPKIISVQNLPFGGCEGDVLKMKAVIISPETITSYSWDFGDGVTSTDSIPVHTYAGPGNYIIKLIISTANGCTDSFTGSATVSKAPVAKFILTPSDACASSLIQFTDQSTGNPITGWFWDFGDGTTSTLQNPTHIFSDTGKFVVQLTVSSNGCKNILKGDSVYIHPPIAKFGVTNQCQFNFIKVFTDSSIGVVSRVWNFGDGQTDTSRNPMHTYASAGIYTVTLTVTNGSCSSVLTKTVPVVKLDPSFTYIPDNPIVNPILCRYNFVWFTVTNYDPSMIRSFYWDFGDKTNATVGPLDSVTEHPFNYLGVFSPVLIATDILGCKDTISNVVTYSIYGPGAEFSPAVAGDCLGKTVTFIDKSTTDGTHNIVKWIWDYGDGTIDTLSGPPFQHTYNKTDTFNIQLKVIDSYGCSDFLNIQKDLIITQPHADFSVSDSSRCAKNNITFTNLSTSGALSSSWKFGDGGTSTESNPVYNYPNQGIYSVELNITDQFGCTDSITKQNILTISNPVASFNLTDTFATCPPLFIQPLNTSRNYQKDSVVWQFGDGNISTLVNPVHNYTNGGTYHFVLTVKGYGDCYDSASKTVVVQGPSGIVSYPPHFAGCEPATITVKAVIKNSILRTWDFGDGNVITNTADSATNTYKNYGLYLPKLLLSDPKGCLLTVAGSDSVRISGIFAGLHSVQQTACDSSSINFVDSSRIFYDTLSSYSWNFGDNSGVSTLQNPNHKYYTSGNYSVTHTVQSVLGCKDSITDLLAVKVHAGPRLTINTVDSACKLSAVQFFAKDTAVADTTITSWQWDFGNGGTDSGQQPVYTFPSNGSFNVSVAATNADGCINISSRKITILPLPIVDAGTDTTLCLGQSLTLNPTGANSYVWQSQPSLSCNQCYNPVARPNITTRYFVTGTTLGCKATDSLLVQVKLPFTLTLAPSDSLCIGQSVQLQASGGDVFQWLPATGLNNSTIANPVANPSATTTYTLIASDNKNCFSDTGKITVSVFPVPTFNIVDSSITLIVGYSDSIRTINSNDVVRWEWTPATWLSCSNCSEPVTKPGNNIVYTAKAYNKDGCSASDHITVNVFCSGANVYIPNTFSPNGNGMNERFYPRGIGLFGVRVFRVFNRSGLVVFEKYSATPNTASDGWDGTYKGQPAPTGVYVYTMEVTCNDNTVFNLKGNVTLIR